MNQRSEMSSLLRYGPAIAARQIRIQAPDGCALNVRVLREAVSDSAAPVLLIHALAMDGDMWQGVVDVLNDSHPQVQGALLALDCRGHGASESSDGEFTTSQFAQDILAVLDAVKATRAHLAGCSMGGTVSLRFAGLYPQRVASLTVVDSTAWYGADAPEKWEQRAKTALTEGLAALIEFQKSRWFNPKFLVEQPALVQQAVEVFLANRVSAYASSCRMLGQADERAVMTAYKGPAVVVVGEEDYATPLAMSELIKRELTNAALAVIPGTRHYTPLEAPSRVAECIAAVAND
jgi:3-oxoadipate enol-lactonase